MANIPTQDRPASPQNRVQQMSPRSAGQYNRPMQYPPQGVPQRTPQPQRMPQPQQIYPHANNMRQSGYPSAPMPPRAKAEQLRPIKSQKTDTSVNKKAKSNRPRKKDFSKLKDFLLAFTVSLVLFGIAAIIVCNALISLFS